MNVASGLLILHLLGAVVWVGGMVFSLLVLRPSLAVLGPAERVALHAQVFRRFFLLVWHAMPIMIVTGLLMVSLVYGGWAVVGWNVHAMAGLGVLMAAIFVGIVFRPWAAMRTAIASGDTQTAARSADAIRRLVTVNLVLGLITVVISAWAV